MQNCTLFLPLDNRSEILKTITEIFPKAEIFNDATPEDWSKIKIVQKTGWLSKSELTIHFSSFETPEQFVPMMQGMMNFISKIPAQNKTVQSKMMVKVQKTKSALGIVSTEMHLSENELFKIIQKYNGYAFVNGNSWLDSSKTKILDTNGISDLQDLHDIADEDIQLAFAEQNKAVELTESQKNRKKQSIDYLKTIHVPTIDHLPCVVDDNKAQIRSKEEIVQRIIAIALTVVKIEDAEGNILQDIINQYSAKYFFTPEEQLFINQKELSQQDMAKFSWRYECLWVFLWSLNLVNKLELPTTICDGEEAVAIIQNAESYEGLLKIAQLRSTKEILDGADLIYRMNWACVNAGIQQKEMPAQLDRDIVYERHYAFNWLITTNNEDWDDVSTNT